MGNSNVEPGHGDVDPVLSRVPRPACQAVHCLDSLAGQVVGTTAARTEKQIRQLVIVFPVSDKIII